MTLVYLDTSAFLRAFLDDADDHANVKRLLTGTPKLRFISSELLWLEARRTAIRIIHERPGLADLKTSIETALQGVTQVPCDSQALTAASRIPEIVKSLDAIHIATVEALRDSLSWVLTYDQNMTTVLRARGIEVKTAAQSLTDP
jgi:predicted nucleic acid-binding protein